MSTAARQQAEPQFQRDEFLETLLRIRDTQKRRYAREVSPGLQVRVEHYAQLKRAHEERSAAQ